MHRGSTTGIQAGWRVAERIAADREIRAVRRLSKGQTRRQRVGKADAISGTGADVAQGDGVTNLITGIDRGCIRSLAHCQVRTVDRDVDWTGSVVAERSRSFIRS